MHVGWSKKKYGTLNASPLQFAGDALNDHCCTHSRMFLWRLFSILFGQKSSRDFPRSAVLSILPSRHAQNGKHRLLHMSRYKSRGHRRLESEQIEVLVYIHIIVILILYYIMLYYAMGRLRVVVATEWTLVSSPPINNSCMCTHDAYVHGAVNCPCPLHKQLCNRPDSCSRVILCTVTLDCLL